jgi:hypothetical protein
MWIFLIATFGLAAQGQPELIYQRGGTRYTIQRTTLELMLYSSPATHRLRVSECNKKLVDSFWKEIEAKFSGLPELKGSNVANVAHVKLGKVSRLLGTNPFSRSATRFFDRLPQRFIDLTLKERRKCGK